MAATGAGLAVVPFGAAALSCSARRPTWPGVRALSAASPGGAASSVRGPGVEAPVALAAGFPQRYPCGRRVLLPRATHPGARATGPLTFAPQGARAARRDRGPPERCDWLLAPHLVDDQEPQPERKDECCRLVHRHLRGASRPHTPGTARS